jgi:hypothetical protein
MVNKEFAKVDQAFIAACEKVGIQATKRQASKWRANKGLAFKKGK